MSRYHSRKYLIYSFLFEIEKSSNVKLSGLGGLKSGNRNLIQMSIGERNHNYWIHQHTSWVCSSRRLESRSHDFNLDTMMWDAGALTSILTSVHRQFWWILEPSSIETLDPYVQRSRWIFGVGVGKVGGLVMYLRIIKLWTAVIHCQIIYII